MRGPGQRIGAVTRARASAMAAMLPVLLFGVGMAPTSVTTVRKGSRPAYGIPTLKPGQLWVSSVPVGLEVYVGDHPEGKPVGRTPVVLDVGSVGSHVTVSVQKSEYGGQLPSQRDLIDFSAERSHSLTIRNEDVSRALTYKVDSQKKQTVIALFQPRSVSLSDMSRFYPQGSNFRFRESLVRRELAAKGVPPEYVRRGIRLLHRGGKIALPGRDGWLVAEVTPSGMVAIIDATSRSSR